MQNKYFQKIQELLEQANPELSTMHRLEFKNVFGAVGGYINGRIFISCGKFGVALKLPKVVLDDLFKDKDIKHLRYFPNGHIKKEYAVLPRRILENKNMLKKIIDKSIQFIET